MATAAVFAHVLDESPVLAGSRCTILPGAVHLTIFVTCLPLSFVP